MIGKIMAHKPSFRGRAAYALYEKDSQVHRDAWTVTRNLEGIEPEHAHIVMEATAKQSKRVQKPCGHMVLSWAQNDNVDDDTMVDQIDLTMKDLGLSEHQAMYIAHDDTDHRHVHVIFNRVHPDTHKAASDSNERRILRRSLMQQEQNLGLTQTPYRSRGRHKRPEFSEIKVAEREDREVLTRMSKQRCDKLKEDLAYCFETAMGWSSLNGLLTRRGYNLTMAGPGIRIVRHQEYAKLSDALPPKVNSKQLALKWGKFSDYWQTVKPPEEKRKRKQRLQQNIELI